MSTGARATPCPTLPQLPHHASLGPQGSNKHLLEKCFHFHRPPARSSNRMFQEERSRLGAAEGTPVEVLRSHGAYVPFVTHPALFSWPTLSDATKKLKCEGETALNDKKIRWGSGNRIQGLGIRTRASRFSSSRQVGFASLQMETFFPALLGT